MKKILMAVLLATSMMFAKGMSITSESGLSILVINVDSTSGNLSYGLMLPVPVENVGAVTNGVTDAKIIYLKHVEFDKCFLYQITNSYVVSALDNYGVITFTLTTNGQVFTEVYWLSNTKIVE